MTTPFSYKRQIVASRVDCSKTCMYQGAWTLKLRFPCFRSIDSDQCELFLSKLTTQSTFVWVQVLKYTQSQVEHFKLMVSTVYLIRTVQGVFENNYLFYNCKILSLVLIIQWYRLFFGVSRCAISFLKYNSKLNMQYMK